MNKRFFALTLLIFAITQGSLKAKIEDNIRLVGLDKQAFANELVKWPLSGHSFFAIRPPFQSSSPEKTTLFRDWSLARECGFGGAFQVVPFGGQSGKRTNLGTWFSFNELPVLVVAENQAAGALVNGQNDPNFRDVNAAQFNIQTTGQNFKSIFGFQPRHSFAGVGFTYRQYLHSPDACEKKWWFEASFPVVWVKNDMNITESIQNQGTPLNDNVNKSIKEAFKGQKGFFNITTTSVTGSQWQFGKIDGAKKRTHLADIEVKLGYDFLCEDMCHAEGYVGGVIPASTKPKGEFVFEPMTGNNFHGGVMWGGSFGWEVWSRCNDFIHIEVETNWRYLFKNTQTRSFEVTKKPWSRYMLVFRNPTDAQNNIATEAINVFTKKLHVRPHFNADLNIGFVYNHCGLEFELGYNLWKRQAEKLTLKDPFEETLAFVNLDNNNQAVANMINRAITIGENFNGTGATVNANTQEIYNLNRIQPGDLNLDAPAHPCAIAHTVYTSLGHHWDDLCLPIFVGVGASYQFSALNSAMNKWTAWGKFGLAI